MNKQQLKQIIRECIKESMQSDFDAQDTLKRIGREATITNIGE